MNKNLLLTRSPDVFLDGHRVSFWDEFGKGSAQLPIRAAKEVSNMAAHHVKIIL